MCVLCFCFKQKTAYEMRISDWSSDVCSSDLPEAVQPFLFNLFNDHAILPFFQPVRGLLASFIAKRRVKETQKIYAHLGGGSPLLPNTQQQIGRASCRERVCQYV